MAWALAYFAGLRMGEIQGLFRLNVDMVERLITVVMQYDRKDRLFVEVKTKSGDRTVPIQEVLLPFFAANDELVADK